ncbi:MAG: hypothetical protein HYY65_07760 [Candidatus Tectomicrobia bacterium]|uniref:DUF2029 domain-containing protein n=1 Tax=Tectimicrobiota bacterium TaxID=2528274 RepID=A0A932M1K6_UNCTE|nr:hypothetical protein [Candidatus Tectomicrobia bacterium]
MKKGLWLLGLLSAVVYSVNFRVGDLLTRVGILSVPPQKIISYLFQLVPLSLFYVLSLRLVRRAEGENGKHAIPGILLLALLFRLPLALQAPDLSSDLYRYLWDGKVQVSGAVNPYLYPPGDERLAFLRDQEIYPNVNRKEAPTIYPAGAQLLFRGLNWAGLSDPGKFKAAALAAEGFTLFLLLLILKELRLPQSRLLIYAWNPLVIYELFQSGHLESFLLPPLLGFVYFFLRGRLVGAGAALGLATSMKLIPALFLVTIPPGKRLKIALPFLLVVMLAYLPYAGAGEKIFGFLPSYFSDPSEIFNPGLIQTGLLWVASAFTLSSPWIRPVLLLLLLVLLLPITRCPEKSPADVVPKLYLTLSAYFFLIYPALHPWYLSWLIPFLCLIPSRAWLYLSLALPLSYLKYLAPDGTMPTWVTWVEFAPLYALLAAEYARVKPVNQRISQWCLETRTQSSTTF